MTSEEMWTDMAVGLRGVLAGDGATPHAIDWIVADLRPRYLEMMAKTPPIRFYGDPDTRRKVTDVILRSNLVSLTQMIRLEVEIYRLKFGECVTAEKQAQWAAAVLPEAEPGARVN